LIRVRRWLGLRLTLLFANGGAHTPEHYARADAIQVLTRQQYDEAIAFGIAPDRLFHIPHGVECAHFARPTEYDREPGRAAHGIPANAWVVLGVTALAMSEKRADWLVREVARLNVPNAFLLLAGQEGPETGKLRGLAATLLPGRHAFTTVAPDRVRELYWLADVMVLPSLREGFGLAAIEAAAAGTPVVVHDGPHFRGLLAHDASFVDMAAAGALSARLSELHAAPERSIAMADANGAVVCERFDWSVLAPAYVAMYDVVGAMRNTMSIGMNDANSRRTR
jgi:glycosyltransferase involved in cell wall biosynthesis